MKNDFWNGRRVLITGSSGFLGGWLARLLLEAGAEPIGYDIKSSTCLTAHGLDANMPLIKGSVLDLEQIESVIREQHVEVCFHLAGQSMIEDASTDPTMAFDLNVRGTWTILEACRRTDSIIGVACASSNHTYGTQESAPFPETAALNQLDVYGASKASADIITRTYARQFGLPAVAVRNTNSFGPADPHTTHVVTGTTLSLLRNEAPVIRSDGSPVKAYLHAQDTMEAYMILAQHASDPEVCGEAFNVTANSPISVLELAKTIVEISGKKNLQPVVQSVDLSQKDTYEHLSNKKIRRLLGWQPRFSLEEGLRKTYEWYEEHGLGWMEQPLPGAK